MLLGEPPERASFSGRYGWQHCRTLFSLADSETSRLAESLARRRDLRGVALWGGGCVALRACGQVVCLDCPVDAKPRLERLVAGRAVIYYLSAGALRTRLPTLLAGPCFCATTASNRGVPPPGPGPQEQCYVQFSDGHTAWNAPDGFTDALHACDTPVAAVAFGGWGTWTILFKDGSATWCGIPPVGYARLPFCNPEDIPRLDRERGSGGVVGGGLSLYCCPAGLAAAAPDTTRTAAQPQAPDRVLGKFSVLLNLSQTLDRKSVV